MIHNGYAQTVTNPTGYYCYFSVVTNMIHDGPE